MLKKPRKFLSDMILKRLFPIFTAVAILVLPSCLGKEDKINDYSEWRELNTNYFDSLANAMVDGHLVYQEIKPDWDKSFSILMRWHNEDRNPSFVTPLSTSTCIVNYTLTNISGDTLDSSAGYSCVPNKMITGFMAALTNMRVNDTVTAVIPYTAGYGVYGSGAVYPYSTLIFGIRLDSISRLM